MIAACIKSGVIFFVISISGIDKMVGKVLAKACDHFVNIFIRGEWWSRAEGKSQSE